MDSSNKREWLGWSVVVGDVVVNDLNQTQARRKVEEKLNAGVPHEALVVKHRGRKVLYWSANVLGNRNLSVVLRGPDKKIHYV